MNFNIAPNFASVVYSSLNLKTTLKEAGMKTSVMPYSMHSTYRVAYWHFGGSEWAATPRRSQFVLHVCIIEFCQMLKRKK